MLAVVSHQRSLLSVDVRSLADSSGVLSISRWTWVVPRRQRLPPPLLSALLSLLSLNPVRLRCRFILPHAVRALLLPFAAPRLWAARQRERLFMPFCRVVTPSAFLRAL